MLYSLQTFIQPIQVSTCIVHTYGHTIFNYHEPILMFHSHKHTFICHQQRSHTHTFICHQQRSHTLCLTCYPYTYPFLLKREIAFILVPTYTQNVLQLRRYNMSWGIVVVKWSASSSSTPTIQILIPLKATVLIL